MRKRGQARAGFARRRGWERGCWMLKCGRRDSCVIALGGVLALVAVPLRAEESLTYALTPRVEDGGLQVELTWHTEGRSDSALCIAERWGAAERIPAWLRNVRLSGAAVGGQDATCWKLHHAAGATITCRYEVVTGHKAFDWNCTHAPLTTPEFFHGIGATFLLAPQPGYGGQPSEFDAIVRWQIPGGWKAVCSWGTGKTVGAHLNVDDLRHSVFFVVTAIPVGEEREQGSMTLSGTGLYRSFALFMPPRAELNDSVDHLLAHELFHYWNGRVLKADDPEELVYWFTEGFTDYYALRILYESQRWSGTTFAKWVNRHLRGYATNPARNATNERIRAEFWKERDTVGEAAYQRGLLLGLRWHRLAHEHGVSEGVDRFVRALVERGRAGHKLSNTMLRKTAEETLGTWIKSELERYVERGETVDVPVRALEPEFVGQMQTVYEFELGFDRANSIKAKKVIGLVPESAAARAGLREGDELTGWSITADADQEATIRVRRGGEARNILYYPRGPARHVLQFHAASSSPQPG